MLLFDGQTQAKVLYRRSDICRAMSDDRHITTHLETEAMNNNNFANKVEGDIGDDGDGEDENEIKADVL